MNFDGAFSLQGAGAGVVFTSPTGEQLFYAVQLDFKQDKVSNNIAEYEGLIAGLRAAISLGIKRLIIRGDSQLVINQSNKDYKCKDPRMAAYLAEVRKLEKHFLGMQLEHIPRLDNHEADDLAKKAAKREPLPPGVFEERLLKPSAKPAEPGEAATSTPGKDEQGAPISGAPGNEPPPGDRVLLAFPANL